MAKLSAVEISTLLFGEQGSDPSTPGTDTWRLYAKADGVYAINDAGTVVGPFGASGGGDVPGWVSYLAARQSGEASHADDDFFDDDDHSSWTKLNVTGNQTVTEKHGLLSVVFDSQTSSDLGAALIALTPSSAPVTIETAMTLIGKDENYTLAGICFSDGVTATDSIAAATIINNTIDNMRSGTFTAAGAPGGGSVVLQPEFAPYARLYLRATWKSANTFKASVSPDGVSWTALGLGDGSVTLTPTHFGLVWSRWGGGAEPSVVSFDYVRVYESDLSV